MTANELSQRLEAAQKCLAARGRSRCKGCPDSGMAGVCVKNRLTPLEAAGATGNDCPDIKHMLVQLLRRYIETERLLAKLTAQGWAELPPLVPNRRDFRAPVLDDAGQEIIKLLPTHRTTSGILEGLFIPILAFIENRTELEVALDLVAPAVANVVLQLLAIPVPQGGRPDV